MKLSNITKPDSIVRFETEWNGEKFYFEAKENAVSPKVLQAFKDTETRPIELANGLAELITNWDVFREEPGDFPPTAANLATLDFDFLQHVLEILTEAWAGNAQKPKQSVNTSGASANSATK